MDAPAQAHVDKLISEVAWRDFYFQILHHFPGVWTRTSAPPRAACPGGGRTSTGSCSPAGARAGRASPSWTPGGSSSSREFLLRSEQTVSRRQGGYFRGERPVILAGRRRRGGHVLPGRRRSSPGQPAINTIRHRGTGRLPQNACAMHGPSMPSRPPARLSCTLELLLTTEFGGIAPLCVSLFFIRLSVCNDLRKWLNLAINRATCAGGQKGPASCRSLVTDLPKRVT